MPNSLLNLQCSNERLAFGFAKVTAGVASRGLNCCSLARGVLMSSRKIEVSPSPGRTCQSLHRLLQSAAAGTAVALPFGFAQETCASRHVDQSGYIHFRVSLGLHCLMATHYHVARIGAATKQASKFVFAGQPKWQVTLPCRLVHCSTPCCSLTRGAQMSRKESNKSQPFM